MTYHVITAPKKTIDGICRKYPAEYTTDTFAILRDLPDEIKSIPSLRVSTISEEEYRAILDVESKASLKQGMPVTCTSGKYRGLVGILREVDDTCLVELSTAGSMVVVKLTVQEIASLEIGQI